MTDTSTDKLAQYSQNLTDISQDQFFQFVNDAKAFIATAQTPQDLQAVRVNLTGKKSHLTTWSKQLGGLDADGKKVKGILKAVDGNDFTVGVEEKVKVEGKKRPVKQEVDYAFQMDKVKYTKYVISFK